MSKALVLSTLALYTTLIYAQDYQISFAILGDNESKIDSIVVSNADQSNTITLNGNDILHLVGNTTGIEDSKTSNGQLEIYPNPFSDRAIIAFRNEQQGPMHLSLFEMTGRIVAQKSTFQPAGKIIAEARGLPLGAYVIQVDTETSIFSKVILSNCITGNNPEIIKQDL